MNLSADEILVELLPLERLVSVTRWADSGQRQHHRPRARFRVPHPEGRHRAARRAAARPGRRLRVHRRRLPEASSRRPACATTESTASRRCRGSGKAILDLGRAVGEPAAAERVVKAFDAKLADVARRLAGVKQPRLLYWSSGMTAGADTAIGSLIECAGARNVGRELGLTGIVPPGGERAVRRGSRRDPGRHVGEGDRSRQAGAAARQDARRCAKAASSRCRRRCWSRSRSSPPTRA